MKVQSIYFLVNCNYISETSATECLCVYVWRSILFLNLILRQEENLICVRGGGGSSFDWVVSRYRIMNRRSLFIASDHHPHRHHDRLLGGSTTSDYKNPHLPNADGNAEEEDPAAAEETAPLHKQQSTDNQTDSEQTMTSHLSLPHFALHRQV